MAAPDPYAGLPDPITGLLMEFKETDFKEVLKMMRPSGENIFSKKRGESSASYFVPSRCLEAAMRYFIGYDAVTNSAPFVLQRKNPIRHPRYSQLWANGVAEVEFKPDSKTAARLKRAASFALRTDKPKRLPYRTGYDWAQLLVRFGPVDYDVREDFDPDFPDLSAARKEYLRNLALDTEPRVETVETKLPFTFIEGTLCPAPYTNPKGLQVIAERAQLILRPDLLLAWRDVPEKWIMKTATLVPSLILDALGKLNDDEFLGYPKGTLLLMGAKLTKSPWTLLPEGVGFPPILESRFYYDVELLVNWFDPTKGFTGASPVQITTNRGHNNFMWPGSQVVGGTTDPNGGRWFVATLNGNTDGKALYEYTSYPKIFDCPQNYP